MLLLQMAFENLQVLMMMPWSASVDQTLQLSEFLPSLLHFERFVEHFRVLPVYIKIPLILWSAKLLIGKGLCLCDKDLLTLGLADGALLVIQDEPESQDAGMTHVLVVADPETKVFHVVETEDAVLLVS